MKTFFKVVAILVFASIFQGCGSSSNDSSGGDKGQPGPGPAENSVAWESISSDFNPRIEEKFFRVDRIEMLEMDHFGFSDDVQVKYSNQLAADESIVKTYTVYKNRASFGGLNISRVEKKILLNRYGQYECSIRIQNRVITELDGGCLVRVEVILPINAQIEVYNLKRLLTKRFIAVDTVSFLKKIRDASFDDDKLLVITDYLDSYVAVNKTPALETKDMEIVLESFSFSKNTFTALEKLQRYITDRAMLRAMIDRVFSTFDREKAYRICGV